MERYTHENFAEYVDDIVPNPDDISFNDNLLENQYLGSWLMGYTQSRTEERMKDGVFTLKDIPVIKVMELIDAFIVGFTAGRHYERKDYASIRDLVGDNGADK